MRRMVLKQTLSCFDEPSPPPAALDLDLSHAAQTFQPPVFDREELPASIPVVSKRTGKIKRFIRFKSRRQRSGRRIVSMPSLSPEKALPNPPPPEQTRAVTMLSQDHRLFAVEEESTASDSCSSSPSANQASSVYSSLAETHPKPKHVIVDDDNEEIDSLFSGGAKSTIPSETSDTHSAEFAAKDLLELMEIYEAESAPSESSVHSEYFFEDGLVEYDQLSSKDSLFSDKNHQTQAEANAAQKDLPKLPKEEVNGPHSHLVVSKIRKDHRRATSNHAAGCTPQKSNHSVSNISCMSTASNMSLKDQKAELKKQVRQRPFSYCLDAANDYNYSKYGAVVGGGARSISANPYKDYIQPRLTTPLVDDLKRTTIDSPYFKKSPGASNLLAVQHPQSSSQQPNDFYSVPYRSVSFTPPSSLESAREQTIKNTIASFLTKNFILQKGSPEELHAPKVPHKDKPLPAVTERQNRFGRISSYN